jgi:hypothetical protein
MASFGRVLNLLDHRYLELQDVTGNVEPMPTLVPYDRYEQNVLVYRMDTNHDLFLGLIQDFTMRTSQQLGKELWTWLVQWEVDSHSTSAPSPKKPRLNLEPPGAETDHSQAQRRAPIVDIFERQLLDPELINEEDMLRVLIDIVQVESRLVPNFIEFLYRWIDHYEGDGKALKAALKWEIPSLWDFEYHPLVLPEHVKKEADDQNSEQSKSDRQLNGGGPRGQGSMAVKASDAQCPVLGSSTKEVREKPDLATLERHAEESERLQYREVKYGIQPPKLHRPLTSLINIPTESSKCVKYYAACFRSRQRALVLLLEAGINMQQISNYQKLQEAHPRDTPSNVPHPEVSHDSHDEPHKEFGSLQPYHDDAKAAQDYYNLREKLQVQREKQKEIAISNKLAVEARLVARGSASDDSSGVPLIPPTPSYTRRPDMAAHMLARIRAGRSKREERINFIPTQLVGKMKSKLMVGAKDKRSMQEITRRGVGIPHNTHSYTPRLYDGEVSGDEVGMESEEDDDDDETESEDEAESDSESEESSDDEDGDDDEHHTTDNSINSQVPQLPGALDSYSAHLTGALPPGPSHSTGATATGGMPGRSIPTPAYMAQYVLNLTTNQAGRLVPLLNHVTQQAVASNPEAQASSGHDVTIGAARQGPTFSVLPSMRPTGSIGAFSHIGIVAGAGQPRSAPVPLPRPSSRPPTAAVPLGPQRPTLPFSPPPQTRPQNHAGASTQGLNELPRSQFPLHLQVSRQPPALSSPQSCSQSILPPDQCKDQASNGIGGSSQHPQTSRLPQVYVPVPSLSLSARNTLLPIPQPKAGGQTAPTNGLSPRRGFHGGHVLTPDMQPPPRLNSSVPQHPSNWLSLEQFITLRRQQEAGGQLQNLPQSPQLASAPPVPPASSYTQPAHQAVGLSGCAYVNQQTFNSQSPYARADIDHSIQQTTRPDTPTSISRTLAPSIRTTQSQQQLPPSSFSPRVSTSINRNAPPTPLKIPSAPSSPNSFALLGPQSPATIPFAYSPNGIPIQIYFPRIVVPGNGIGPDGKHLGDNDAIETDAFLIGYTHPRSGKIVLSTALFMPVGCWANSLNRVRKGAYKVLETYPALRKPRAHQAVYEKLAQAYGIMRSKTREDDLTKRWRASQGPMTQRERGAVWEGWGAVLDREIEMGKKDREGAILSSCLIDEGVDGQRRGPEEERRWREIEELLEEEDWDEDVEM